jgi:hypothetical protein
VVDDDRAVRERLAALEIEVKAKADADRARKEAALAKIREQRAAQQAERDALSARQAQLHSKTASKASARAVEDEEEDEDGDDIGNALALAKRAHGVKQELTKPRAVGEKSWVTSGVLSLLLGPLGWLYAGSWREAIPASAVWLGLGYVANAILPMFLLMPVMMVVLPVSAITGVVYAVQHNRKGGRQRLFGKAKAAAKKQLPGK